MEEDFKLVIKEKEELDLKIKNLQNFIEKGGEIWQVLEGFEQQDLKEQLKHMQIYTHILQKKNK